MVAPNEVGQKLMQSGRKNRLDITMAQKVFGRERRLKTRWFFVVEVGKSVERLCDVAIAGRK